LKDKALATATTDFAERNLPSAMQTVYVSTLPSYPLISFDDNQVSDKNCGVDAHARFSTTVSCVSQQRKITASLHEMINRESFMQNHEAMTVKLYITKLMCKYNASSNPSI
jgi:hypothetical protein